MKVNVSYAMEVSEEDFYGMKKRSRRGYRRRTHRVFKMRYKGAKHGWM